MESLKASFENFKNTNFRQMLLQVVNLGAERCGREGAKEGTKPED